MVTDWWLRIMTALPVVRTFPRWTSALLLLVVVVVVYAAVSRIAPFFAPKTRREIVRLAFARTRIPVQILLILSFGSALVAAEPPPPPAGEIVARTVPFLVVVAAAWFAYRFVGTFFLGLRRHFDISTPDNLKARRALTQIIVLERIVGFAIAIIALSVGLMMIPGVGRWGASLLASAGVVGLLVGIAAQQTIANVLAGIQIAVTQPVRIDDTVVVDGEWGHVEEITLTYVVVRIWDKRRLIVPISHLLQNPFQNWTRSSSSIIGSVYIYADYTIDIDALRVEQSRALAADDLWDGEVDVIQMTNTTERTVELRSLVSAADAPSAWDLRCRLRERLVRWIKENQPDALPRERMRIQGTVAATTGPHS